MGAPTIDAFHAALAEEDRRICDRLRAVIDRTLPEADSKMWHAHPVWFLDGNPIVGYSRLKAGSRLFFWSGQSFSAPGLTASGRFKAAEKLFTDASEIDEEMVRAWLTESRDVQWDYKNIVKRKGELVRIK